MNIYSGPLGKFIKQNFSSPKSVLEIGPGNNPLAKYFFEPSAISYIDKEVKFNGFKKNDFLELNFEKKFDVIFDSLCMHEQPTNSWNKYLQKVYDSLNTGGSFICRHGISTPETSFEEDHLLFIQQEGSLLKQVGNEVIFSNFLPRASHVEEALTSKGFQINFFKISQTEKLILHRHSSTVKITDPDLLEFVVTKA